MYICYQNVLNMAQTAFTVRMDSQVKKDFDSLCDAFGMSTTTAINIFAKMVIRKRKIPFEIEANDEFDVLKQGREAFLELRKEAQESGLKLKLDEINEEIKLAREGK